MSFEIKQFEKPNLSKPILIEGLPGIGNVGKITADFIIDDIKAKKFIEIYSKHFPNSVFVNEENLVNLPSISMYYKKTKKQDYIFLAGDIQPLNENACYDLCTLILDILKQYNGKEVITIGGIGMPKIPKNPLVYCTANDKNIIKKYKNKDLNDKIFGTVGPIMGVTGLLIGLAKNNKIPAIALLAQTFGHPNYLGIKGARAIIKILNDKLNLNININRLDKEIKSIEREIKLKESKKQVKEDIQEQNVFSETSYIG